MSSAFQTLQEKSMEVKNSRLRADMKTLFDSANAELILFNEKLSGQ